MQEQLQLCNLQKIRVLIREVVELNELRARVLEAEARLRAKYTRTQSPGLSSSIRARSTPVARSSQRTTPASWGTQILGSPRDRS
jgi:hypothetical protein